MVDRVFKLGACWGYFQEIGLMPFAAKVAFDEGFFDDILPFKGFKVELSGVDVQCDGSVASRMVLPLLAGQGTESGRFYSDESSDPVIAISGCTCSGATMGAQPLSGAYKVPMVSGSSSSPKLSNKATYPYFARTFPPDNIQAKGFAKLAVAFKWKRVIAVHLPETYGTGVAESFREYAAAGEIKTSVEPMVLSPRDPTDEAPKDPASYDYQKDADIALEISKRTPQPRIFLFAGQPTEFMLRAFYEAGLVTQKTVWMMAEASCHISKLTFVASKLEEFIKVDPSREAWWRAYAWEKLAEHVSGMLCLLPPPTGPKFNSPEFMNFWGGLTLAKLEAVGIPDTVNKTKAATTWLPTTEIFADNVYNAFTFDAMATLIYTISSMLSENSSRVDIEAMTLYKYILNQSFEGISGSIAFNELGDRLAPYEVHNVQMKTGRRLSGGAGTSSVDTNVEFVKVGVYDGPTDSLKWESSTAGQVCPLCRFADGSTNAPADRPAQCVAGMAFDGVSAECKDCASGMHSPAVDTRCLACAAGKFTDVPGLSECLDCPKGRFAGSTGQSTCEICGAGSIAKKEKSKSCTECPKGEYSNASAMSACILCGKGRFVSELNSIGCKPCEDELKGGTTDLLGATGLEQCVCPSDKFRDKRSGERLRKCESCLFGMKCDFGSDMHNYELESGVYPELKAGFWSDPAAPLEVYRCANDVRCPGGAPGACRKGSKGRSCAVCEEEWASDGERCVECATGSDVMPILFPVLPILLVPIVICSLYFFFRDMPQKWGSWQNCCAALSFLMLNHYQMVSVTGGANIPMPPIVDKTWKVWAMSEDAISIFNPACAGFGGFKESFTMRALVPICLLVLVLLTFGGNHLFCLVLKKPQLAMEADRTVNVFFSIIFAFFVGLASMSMSLFKAQQNPSAKPTLAADLSIIYNSEEWRSMLWLAILCILVYTVGCILLFGTRIYFAPAWFADERFQKTSS